MKVQRLELGLPSAITPRKTLEMTQSRCGAKWENNRAYRDCFAALFEDRTLPPVSA
jgi:hypothetical protein